MPAEGGGDISRTVMLDPALTAAVLRAANAAHLGYSRRIGGVRQATVMLGGTLVASLAAGRVADLVFDPDPPAYPDWLWPHSLAVAASSAVLAKICDESVDDAFTAGLLHDVGWLLAATNRADLDDGDQEHATAGAELLSRWNFPDRLVASVQHHHLRAGALVDQLERVVVAAHAFAKEVGATSPEPSVSRMEALELLDLTDLRTAGIVAEIEQELTSMTSDLRGAA